MSKIGIQIDKVTNDKALNPQFSTSGFDSKLFIKNSGSSLFFFALYILIWLIFSCLALSTLFL